MTPILKEGVRIWRPFEVKALIDSIPKFEHQIIFKVLLYSGMRYAEAKRFKDNPNWYDGNFIHLISLKKKARQKERWIHLTPRGKEVIATFLQLDMSLPVTNVWWENLHRWGKKANMDTVGFSPKSTRKTYESWLVWYFPEKQNLIMLSQGHTDAVSFNHYLNMPFTDKDKIYMKEFVEGWI
jgi:integrase